MTYYIGNSITEKCRKTYTSVKEAILDTLLWEAVDADSETEAIQIYENVMTLRNMVSQSGIPYIVTFRVTRQ